jgi:hypothetical protein
MGFQKLLPLIEIIGSWATWRILWRKMRIKLKFNNAYHLQIYWKKEVVNHSLGSMLWIIVGEKPKQWDLTLPLA